MGTGTAGENGLNESTSYLRFLLENALFWEFNLEIPGDSESPVPETVLGTPSASSRQLPSPPCVSVCSAHWTQRAGFDSDSFLLNCNW